jgi:Tol biopolymer transport system component
VVPKTFERQAIFNARFALDGQTLVYSGSLDGNVPQLFVVRPDSTIPRVLGKPGTHLLSVSSSGELAVLLHAKYIMHRLFSGTLARMTMDGEAKPWMNDVREADWAPNGSSLAIVRVAGSSDKLEFPIGHVLYQTEGYVSDLRVSPDGSRVAFMDHLRKWDDHGWVKIVSASGQVTVLPGEYWGEEGMAWAPDGTELFFSAADVPGVDELLPRSVLLSGQPVVRQALTNVGQLWIHDVARDGRWLVTRQDEVASIRGLVPGEREEKEFPWLNYAVTPSFSPDGKSLVFSDESLEAGANYKVAVRRIDGAPPLRLGDGFAGPFSPDGKWVLGALTAAHRVAKYPVETGDAEVLDVNQLERLEHNVGWLPDGRLTLCGNEKGQQSRCYVYSGSMKRFDPITPAGMTAIGVAPDGRSAVVGPRVEAFTHVMPFGGTDLRPIHGLADGDRVVKWTRDSKALIVQTPGFPARLERLDPLTGARAFIKIAGPADRVGLLALQVHDTLDDGQFYLYNYFRNTATLYVLTRHSTQ